LVSAEAGDQDATVEVIVPFPSVEHGKSEVRIVVAEIPRRMFADSMLTQPSGRLRSRLHSVPGFSIQLRMFVQSSSADQAVFPRLTILLL